MTAQDEETDFVDFPAGLAVIAPVRAELLGGDRRLLYLAWLLSVQADDELDDEEMEPPVPAGLGDLSAFLRVVAEFLRIDPDLITVAARVSSPLPTVGARGEAMPRWIEDLPAQEKNRLLGLVLEGKAARARARMLQTYQGNGREAPAAEGARTVRELWAAAGELLGSCGPAGLGRRPLPGKHASTAWPNGAIPRGRRSRTVSPPSFPGSTTGPCHSWRICTPSPIVKGNGQPSHDRCGNYVNGTAARAGSNGAWTRSVPGPFRSRSTACGKRWSASMSDHGDVTVPVHPLVRPRQRKSP
ncbi:hypothetical protein [Nocardiopsis metallicus]|uniref:Uncharacterized protein n=1 Tax=Nocardiopsis metallicus TaxID=179819 RepID=A0A840VWS4_9ACTN|nr:hypothetical protein [Nocardiopsis metallicus]MBB5488880.1 hypothetical protein [Nocardiopsis metallicus]